MSTGIFRYGNYRDIPGIPIISQAVVHDGLVYTTGITGDPGGDVTTQTRQALERIDHLLGAVGATRSSILSAQVWLADMADFADHNSVWDEWVDRGNPPVRACVGAQLYDPQVLVEIRVIAVASQETGQGGVPGEVGEQR
jgi:enamine deaminase RidA (YjgF/YER057c/UK114 family)